MEGNLRRGRPTLCISEAFDFLNNPEYGDKSGKDADPLQHQLKKSVSDTGLLTGNNSSDFKHHTDKNTYTILTFVQDDQSNQKATVTKSSEGNANSCVETKSDKEDSSKFTIVTCVDKSGDNHHEGKSKENSVINTVQCNQIGKGSVNVQSYLPSSDSNCKITQADSNLPVSDFDCSSKEIAHVVETTHSHKRETISPSQPPSHLNSDQLSLQNIHSTNQNEGISENDTDGINHSQSDTSALHTLTSIQNGVSKSVINVTFIPKTKFNPNDGNVDIPTSDSKSNTEIESQTDQKLKSAVCENFDKDPSEGSDTGDHIDEKVVLRPPSLNSPTTPSRRTQQIVSDVFHFLKDIDIDGEEDLKNLGEEFEPSSNDTLRSEISSESKITGKEVNSTPRKNSLGMIPPVPAPKPKRSSSAAHSESNQGLQTGPVSPSRKASPKSPPSVAPKPRRSTSSQVLNSPSTPVQENPIEKQGMQNHTPSTHENPLASKPVSTTDECIVTEDNTPCSKLEILSPKTDSNTENSSSDLSITEENKSLTSGPIIGNESVNSDLKVDDGGWDFGPNSETKPVDSIPTQEEVPSSPVKMRPSLSRSEAIDDSHAITGDARPVEEAEQNLTLRRKKSRNRSTTNDEDSADSSDDDTGIYNESYRNSCWIQLAEEDSSSRTESPAQASSLSVDQTIIESESETRPPQDSHTGPVTEAIAPPSHQDSKDEVFVESVSYKEGRYHKRSDSTTTTKSESEFKREYQFRRKCFVQRSDSQQEYHRLSAKFYDHERLLVIHRTEPTSDLGLHILDSHPAIITSVDPGSPAEKAGVKKGQIILSVNQVNVLQSSHDEIVSLVQDSSLQVTLEVASSDVSLVRDLQSPKVSGFMYKLSNSSFVRNWKKRYFVLRKDNCLYYYKNDQDCADPLGALPLLNYTVSKHTDTSKSHCFKAEKYGAKTYYFYVDTREDMARWVCAMNEAAMVSKKRKESWMDITSHNVGLPALEIRRAECTGYLKKSNKAMKNWNRRYCVLKDACLYYYKSMNSQNAQGMAHLHGYRVDVTGIPVKPFSFILQPPENQMRTFYFVAENETDKQRWVEALRKSVDRWIKVD